MLAADLPARFTIPWANDATAGFVRAIPTTDPGSGGASLELGFPPVTFDPEGAGGIAPNGEDGNGILKWVTQWLVWAAAGGPVGYDATFSTAQGGYPAGAILASTDVGFYWYNTTDNNTVDPDGAGTNWVRFSPLQFYAVSTGTNTIAATLSPVLASYAAITGKALVLKKSGTQNSGATTLNLNGLGATAIVNADGTALAAGQLPANGLFTVAFDGTSFQLQSTSGSTSVTQSQLQLQAGSYAADTGVADAMVVTYSPVPASLGALTGTPLRTKVKFDNATATPTIAVNGLTATVLKNPDGSALEIGQLQADAIIEIVYDGTAFQLISSTQIGNERAAFGQWSNASAGSPTLVVSRGVTISHPSTGTYTFTLTNAITGAAYAVFPSIGSPGTSPALIPSLSSGQTTTSFTITTRSRSSGNLTDCDIIGVEVLRAL